METSAPIVKSLSQLEKGSYEWLVSGRLNNTVLKTVPAKKTVRAHVPLPSPASGALTLAGGLQRAAGLSLIFWVQKDRSLRQIQPVKCGVMQIT